MNLRRFTAILFSLSALTPSCYSPNIARGGFACGSDGGCPDNFRCATNRVCYQSDSVDMMPVCESVTTVKPVTSTFCSTAAASALCNPICQTGCNNCGWCALTGGGATCLTGTAGTKAVGTTCDPSKNSDCLPGLYCQPQSCGTVTTGACYRLCDPKDTTNSVCGANSACRASGGLPFGLCSFVCDPLSRTNVNCPSPFACYPSGATTTECDCAGTGSTGDGCVLAHMCAPGETCIGSSGAVATCRPICTTAVGCTSGTCSIPPGAASGTCVSQ